MSSDIYIELSYVVSHPRLFELYSVVNGCTEHVRDLYDECEPNEQPDEKDVKDLLTPVLMCKFKHLDYTYDVYVGETTKDGKLVQMDLHIPVGGMRRTALMKWLDMYEVPHELL